MMDRNQTPDCIADAIGNIDTKAEPQGKLFVRELQRCFTHLKLI